MKPLQLFPALLLLAACRGHAPYRIEGKPFHEVVWALQEQAPFRQGDGVEVFVAAGLEGEAEERLVELERSLAALDENLGPPEQDPVRIFYVGEILRVDWPEPVPYQGLAWDDRDETAILLSRISRPGDLLHELGHLRLYELDSDLAKGIEEGICTALEKADVDYWNDHYAGGIEKGHCLRDYAEFDGPSLEPMQEATRRATGWALVYTLIHRDGLDLRTIATLTQEEFQARVTPGAAAAFVLGRAAPQSSPPR